MTKWNDYEPPDGTYAPPYDGRMYLVVTKTAGKGAPHKRVQMAMYVEGWQIWPGGYDPRRRVTHWAEMPELPVDAPTE